MKRHVITAFAALLALSACSAEAEPKAEPTPSVTPSPSATPTEEPLRTDTPENTIRSWFAEMERAQNTGDTRHWSTLAVFSCEICIQVISSVSETYVAGGSIQTPPVDIVWLKEETPQNLTPTHRQFTTRVLTHPMTAVLKSGAKETRYPGGFEEYEFQLTQHEGSWIIVKLTRTDLS